MIVCLALIVWLYLLLLHGKFWESGIALFCMAAALASAVHFWRGTGAKWQNRAYGAT